MLERTNQASFFPSSFPTGTIVNHTIKERNKNQSGKERERTHGWKEHRVCSWAAVGASCRARPSCAPHTSALLREGSTEVPAASPSEREGAFTALSFPGAQDALADTLIARSWVSQSRNIGTLGALYLPGWVQLLKNVRKQKLPCANWE